MSCFLCGNEEGSHYLGCACIRRPHLSPSIAVAEGLMAPPEVEEAPPEPVVEVLPENSMTTVPVDNTECTFGECHNPKYSDSPRTKYCEDHKDPKNRKE